MAQNLRQFMTWASKPTIAFNDDFVNASLTADNDAGAPSSSLLNREIGLIELELSQLQQDDPHTAARRNECYIQLGALCQLRKSKQANLSLSNFVDFSFDAQVPVLPTNPFPLASAAQDASDSGIGTSQWRYFNRVDATDVSSFELSATNIQDHDLMTRPFIHDGDLSLTDWTTDSFANTYEDLFGDSRMRSRPMFRSIDRGLTGTSLGDTRVPNFPGTLSGIVQNEVLPSMLPPELPQNLVVFSSELNTLPSATHHSEFHELLINPDPESLDQSGESYGESVSDQNTVTFETCLQDPDSTSEELPSIKDAEQLADPSSNAFEKLASHLDGASNFRKRPLPEPGFPGCYNFALGPERPLPKKTRQKFNPEQLENSRRVKTEGGACWTCHYNRTRCSPGEPCEPCRIKATKIRGELKDPCCRMTLSELNIFAPDAELPKGIFGASSIGASVLGSASSGQTELTPLWSLVTLLMKESANLRTLSLSATDATTVNTNRIFDAAFRMGRSQSYLTIFLCSRSILHSEALVKRCSSKKQRYLREVHAATAKHVLNTLDQTLKPNKLKKFLEEASKIEVLKLLFHLTLVLSQTLSADQIEATESTEKKRTLLRAVLIQHLRYICRRRPTCAQSLDAVLSVLSSKEEFDGELENAIFGFWFSLLRLSGLLKSLPKVFRTHCELLSNQEAFPNEVLALLVGSHAIMRSKLMSKEKSLRSLYALWSKMRVSDWVMSSKGGLEDLEGETDPDLEAYKAKGPKTSDV